MSHWRTNVYWVFLGLVLVWSVPVFSAPFPRLSSRTWQMEEGLPHNAVYAVLQTQDGYLWVATPQGLARFDGLRFTVFNSQNTSEITDSVIRILYETRDGTLWFGGDKCGLTSFKDGKFARNSVVPETQIKALIETHDGALWIGTTNGVARLLNGKLNWLMKEDGLAGNQILSLAEDDEQNLWIGTSSGLSRYKEKLHEIYHDHHYLPVNSVRALFCDTEGSLWIGTSGGGIARKQTSKWNYFKKPEGLPDRFVSAICQDSRGQLWVGTLGGLCRFDGEKFVTELNPEGTSYEAVFALAEDREGNLWMGTKEGLVQLRHQVFQSYTRRDGLSHNNVMSVREDQNGEIWMTTWGGGLNRLNEKLPLNTEVLSDSDETNEVSEVKSALPVSNNESTNGRITVYNYDNSKLYDLLFSICETRDGSLWLGAEYDGGLYRFKEGAFTHFGKEQGLIDPAVRVIHEDCKGDLWIGTSGALYRMREGSMQRFTTRDGLAGNVIRAIGEDAEGVLWIGSNEGLTRHVDDKFSSFPMKHSVLSIYVNGDRNLWIGTDGGGLGRIQKGKLQSYTTKDGLFNDSIAEILEDDRGNLWMSCFSGVFCVKKKNLEEFDRGKAKAISCTAFGKADGMSSVQCNNVSKPAGWKSRDGRMWFPTTRGAVVVNPDLIREDREAPPVVIEEVVVDKNVQSLRFKVQSQEPLGRDSSTLNVERETLNFGPGRGDFEFHYTALGFRVPERNRFKYKLEGVDSDWVDAETRRIAFYNNLKPGNYVFRVIGCNSDGVWNSVGSSVKFTLLPHFWQTTWFLIAMVILSVGAVGGTARYFTWLKVRRRLERLEREHLVERERSRIARDVHDDLGAQLTEILLLNDLAQKSKTDANRCEEHLEKQSDVAREMGRRLDEIIWAVNPKNDSLDRLGNYVYEQVEMFLSSSGIRCRLDVPDELPDVPLSSEVRHNIFLVIRESLNNIVKHAQASEVQFRLRWEETNLKIEIKDNGKGFEKSDTSAFGNGLQNMEKRMRDIGGRFELVSAVGEGTCVRILVPV